MANTGNVLVPVAAPAPAPSPGLDVNNRLLRIDVCVLLTAASLSILVVCGSARRCYYSNFLRVLVQGAYVLSAMLITYTLGQMLSESFRSSSEFFVIWTVFLYAVHEGADCISAFSLADNEQRRKIQYVSVVLSLMTGFSIVNYPMEDTKSYIAVWFLVAVTLFLGDTRLGAFKFASKYGVEKNAEEIASRMRREHGEHTEAETIDPINMTGYRYPMKLEGHTITVDEVWLCKGKLLASTEDDQDSKRKDICLSYALFNILCCRFAGYDLSEYLSHEKTSRFVREGLLSDENRAFRVIEVELAYLYDFFYTKYFAIFVDRGPKYRLCQFFFVGISCYVVAASLGHYSLPTNYVPYTIMGQHVEVMVTAIVVAVFFFAEITQVALFVFSYWAKLYLLCKYVEKTWFRKRAESITRIVCDLSIPWLKPWGRKLGQYSLLTSFHKRPSRIIYNRWTTLCFDPPGKGRAKSGLTKLPEQVKRAVLTRIKTIVDDSPLTNGVTPLRNNGVENDLSWACRLKNQVQVIMVWHIATSMCEHSKRERSPSGYTILEDYITVANSLSKYCAYLVAFAPRLLPGHAYEAEVTFDAIVEQVDKFSEGQNIESLHHKLKLPHVTQYLPQGSVIKESAHLGRMLLSNVDEMRRWKILSDFWTEMILFLAPSGDAAAHAEHLATGGEFVTHLWALLFHAGIDGRDPTINQNV